MKNKIDLTSGNIRKKLIIFSFPIFFSLLLKTFYELIDMLVVGWYVGSTGIASISNVTSLIWLINSIGNGFSTAAAILISQYEGSKDRKKQLDTINTLGFILFIASVLITILSLFFYKDILSFLNVPESAIEYTKNYMYILSFGWIFNFGFVSIASLIRGFGNSMYPFILMIISAILNMIFDFIFVGLFKLGPSGAALSTVVVNFISFFMAFYVLKKLYFHSFKFNIFKIKESNLKPFFSLATPLIVQMIIVDFSYVIITKMANSYGIIIASALGIGMQIHNLITLPSRALSRALTICTGQNFGANKIDNVKKVLHSGLCIGIFVTTFLTLIFNIFSKPILSLFDTNPDVITQSQTYMIYCCSLDCILFSIRNAYNHFASGLGNTKFSCINSIAGPVVLRIALCFLLVHTLNLSFLGIYIGITLSSIFPALTGFLYFKFSKWETKAKSPIN